MKPLALLDWVIVGMSLLNVFLGIMTSNWPSVLGWLVAALGWFTVALRR